jgi:hypothetical protein
VTNDRALERMGGVMLQFFNTLGAFPISRQAAVSFVMSVSKSKSLSRSAFHKSVPQGRIFVKCCTAEFLLNLPRKFNAV